MTDQGVRKRALDPSTSFIVQAPAGSGKTELLTQRILSLLSQAVHEPEELLAITFTNKAAQEMRERVLSSIELAEKPCPDKPHQQQTWHLAKQVLARSEALGWDILNHPQRINILTIDALCARLVKMMPILSKMGVMPDIAQDPSALYREAALKTVEYLLAHQDPQVMILLKHMDNRLDKVIAMVGQMLASREQWLPVMVAHQHQSDIRSLLEHHLQIMIEDKLMMADEALKPFYPELNDLIDFAKEQGALLHEVSGCLQPSIDGLPAWKNLSAWLFTKEGTLRKSVDKRLGFPSPSDAKHKEVKERFKLMKEKMKFMLEAMSEDEALIDALQIVAQLPHSSYDDDSWECLSALIELLPQAAAMLMVNFDEQAQVDFPAVAMGALQALGTEDNPTDVCLMFDVTLKHMLVDEFQDTSYTQYELIARLTAGWQPGDGRTLFLVGDPMQSIYRFRQAEVSLFLKAREQGIGQVRLEPLHLCMNFRSHPTLVNFFNQAASQFFPDRAHVYLGAVPYTASMPALTHDVSADADVYAHQVAHDKEEAHLVLTLLTEALAASHRSIAILVRARSHLKAMTKLLIQSGIPYQAVELEPLSHRVVVKQLLILTRLMVHPGDRTAWIALLRSALCGCSLSDITVICERTEASFLDGMITAMEQGYLSAEGEMILKRVTPVLCAALGQIQRKRLSPVIHELWVNLGGPVVCQQRSDLDDAQQYLHLLTQHEKFGTLFNITYFIQRLDQAFAAPMHQQARIQIMTIHKAKGLEFDVVILPGLSKQASRGDKPVFVWDTLPTEQGEALLFAPIQPLHQKPSDLYQFMLNLRHKKESLEISRLLYVALTRAKHQCHLLLTENPAKGSFAQRLWCSVESKLTVHESIQADDPDKQPSISQLKRIPPAWQHQSLPERPTDEHMLDEALNQVDTAPYAPGCLKDKLFGILLHQALCDLARTKHLSVEPFKQRWYALASEQLGNDAQHVFDTLIIAVEKTLSDPRGLWILSDHHQAYCELPLLIPINGSMTRFVIDRTFIDEAGHRWVIDYKSAASDDPRAEHAAQLESYARALQTMNPGAVRCGLYFPLSSIWIEWEVLDGKKLSA